MARHRHADLIHAWAEGAAMQFKDRNGEWIDIFAPPVCDNTEYRIKPERKPDVLRFAKVVAEHDTLQGLDCEITFPRDANVQFTFCGETGKLIKAEVL